MTPRPWRAVSQLDTHITQVPGTFTNAKRGKETMRKTVFGCLGAAAVAFALLSTPAMVQAQGLFSRSCDPCDAVGLCDPCDKIGNGCCFDNGDCNPCDAVCGPQAGKWFLNGHMEAGFFANAHGNTSRYGARGTGNSAYANGFRGARPTSGNTDLLQNTRLTGAQINQVYVSMGKSVDGRRGLDIGGTVDFTWGSDAYIVQAAGTEFAAGHGGAQSQGRWGTGDYFASFAQAYIEAEYGRWNVKAGKFYAPFGMDSYKSTDNFFYSWSPTMAISPTMGLGAYATYKANSRLSVIGGFVTPDEVGETSDNNWVLGGFIFQATNRLNLKYVFAAGENKYENNLFAGGEHYKGYVHSMTADYQINKRTKYVFDWTYFTANTGVRDDRQNMHTYALMNEIIYQYNKRWAFGTRFGMLKFGELGELMTDVEPLTEWNTVSLGANWTPNKWLVVKPEVRYDWMTRGDVADRKLFDGDDNGDPRSTNQFSGGVSAIVKF